MFGSQARGDATKESDIDLLVILPFIDAKTTRLRAEICQVYTTIGEGTSEIQRIVIARHVLAME